jgi:hypothetical protein
LLLLCCCEKDSMIHRWVGRAGVDREQSIAAAALTIPLVQVLGTTLTTQPSAGALGAAGLHNLHAMKQRCSSMLLLLTAEHGTIHSTSTEERS